MSRLTPRSCRLFGVFARDVPVAVLLRRGPTDRVELIRWDTANDVFERGQWFHGRVYERRCDLSPDGELFVYFAAKHGARQLQSGYTEAWTAISRPPYFTALALWPKGDCWDGGGRFEADRCLHLNHAGDARTHLEHPAPKSLRIITNACGRGEDLPIYNDILVGKGWRRDDAGAMNAELRAWRGPHVWAKPGPDGRLVLRMELEAVDFSRPGGPLHFGFALLRASDGELVEILDAQWADWDRAGRLVYSQGGKLFAVRAKGESLNAIQLADFTDDKPIRVVGPPWASRW
jgi:hypothetical protein